MTFPSQNRMPAFAAGLIVASVAVAAGAAVTEVGPNDDVEAAINAAQPGDEIVLAGGTYTLTSRFGISVSGTEQAPIVIRAKDGEKPILNRPSADQNVIDVDDAEYLVFRGLEISGGSHGLRLVQARFVTVEGCDIHDTGDVALSANSGGSYQGLKILRNHIHNTNNTGEGMYLGCNNNGCQMFDSLIEGNYVHHTNGPTVEQGDGIEIKEGSYNNIVRDNVIHDTNYPCILTYSTVGNGAPNVLERNVLWNCGDHAIQSAADATIRNNIIFGSNAHGIAMQPHQAGVPSNLIVVHNTILHPTNDAINVSGAAGSILIANNAVYAQNGSAITVGGNLGEVVVAGNVGMGGLSGPSSGFAAGDLAADFVAASYSGALPNDVFPKAGSALIGTGDVAHVASDDFNGTPRGGVADVGAYKFDAAGNPGWPIGEGFKDQAPVGSGGAGGAGGSAGSAGSAGSSGAGGSGAAASGGASGSGAAGSGAQGGSSGSGSGGSNAAPGAAEDDSGCGCRAVSTRDSGAPLLVALVIGLFSSVRLRGRAAARIVGLRSKLRPLV